MSQANAERIIQIGSQRAAAMISDANTAAAMLQEALERTQAELAEAKARILELEQAAEGAAVDTPEPASKAAPDADPPVGPRTAEQKAAPAAANGHPAKVGAK